MQKLFIITVLFLSCFNILPGQINYNLNISGTLRDDNGTGIPNYDLEIVIVDSSFQIQNVKTNSLGIFSVTLPYTSAATFIYIGYNDCNGFATYGFEPILPDIYDYNFNLQYCPPPLPKYLGIYGQFVDNLNEPSENINYKVTTPDTIFVGTTDFSGTINAYFPISTLKGTAKIEYVNCKNETKEITFDYDSLSTYISFFEVSCDTIKLRNIKFSGRTFDKSGSGIPFNFIALSTESPRKYYQFNADFSGNYNFDIPVANDSGTIFITIGDCAGNYTNFLETYDVNTTEIVINHEYCKQLIAKDLICEGYIKNLKGEPVANEIITFFGDNYNSASAISDSSGYFNVKIGVASLQGNITIYYRTCTGDIYESRPFDSSTTNLMFDITNCQPFPGLLLVDGTLFSNGVPSAYSTVSIYATGSYPTSLAIDANGYYFGLMVTDSTEGQVKVEFLNCSGEKDSLIGNFNLGISPYVTLNGVFCDTTTMGRSLFVYGNLTSLDFRDRDSIEVNIEFSNGKKQTTFTNPSGFFRINETVDFGSGYFISTFKNCEGIQIKDTTNYLSTDQFVMANLEYCNLKDSLHYLCGSVFALTLPQADIKVVLYKIDSTNNGILFTAVDSVLTSLGYYCFENVPNGNYRIWADVSDSSDIFGEYMPTFYGDHTMWNAVSDISITEDRFDLNIYLIPIQYIPGQNRITVEIRSENGSYIDQTASIFLTDNKGMPMNYEKIMVGENMSFDNINNGEYEIHVNINGIPCIPAKVNINNNNQSRTFIVNSKVIKPMVVSSSTEIKTESLSIFPNPTSGEFSIDTDKNSQDFQIEIYDLTGAILIKTNGNPGKINLDLSTFPNGIYMIKAFNNENVYIGKVQKQR
jgi:hypothetical protein